MGAIRITSPLELNDLVGREIGPSEWFEVTLEKVRMFAEATGDPQWIHLDSERAKSESAFGGLIAHGFFLIAILPRLLQSLISVDEVQFVVNRGVNEARFPAAVPVGRRVNAYATILSVAEARGHVEAETRVRVLVEGARSPSCVASLLSSFYPRAKVAPEGAG